MSLRLLVLLLLPACAGPSAHREPSSGSALNTSQPEAVRAPVATTLASADPLAASNCGLPTAPQVACAAAPAPAPAKKQDPHQHHRHEAPAPAPAPQAPPAPEKKEADPHQHHHGSAAPKRPAPPAPVMARNTVIDPVCKMKIDPKKAGGGSLRHDGQEHFFCSESCRNTFLSQHPGAR